MSKKQPSPDPVRLLSFHIKAYRSCKDTRLGPLDSLAAIIGPNGSGKTNLLQALLLLKREMGHHAWSGEKDLFTRVSALQAEYSVGNRRVSYRAKVRFRTDDKNRDEVIGKTEQWRVSVKGKPGKWIAPGSKDYYLLQGRHYHAYYRAYDPRGFIRSIDYSPIGSQKTSSQLGAILAVQQFNENINYYSASQFTRPSLCPTSFETDEKQTLRAESIPQAKDHTSFIYALYKAYKTKSPQYQLYLSLIDKRGMKLIDNLKWKEVKVAAPAYQVRTGGEVIKQTGQRIIVVPVIAIGGAALSFNQLSEGTLRTLAMLFYIVSDRSNLLLIEEPEVCVHHGLLDGVIEVIKNYSRQKQIIFSTHSEFVLDKLEPENVHLITRSKESGTQARAIKKALSKRDFSALHKFLLTTGSLGEYWRQSGFD